MVLACRDQKRGDQLKLNLEENARQHGNDKPQAEVMLLDVSSLQSVRSFARSWNQRPLHCLVNNAGIFDIGGGKKITLYVTASASACQIVREFDVVYVVMHVVSA